MNNYLIAYSLVSEASLSTNVRAELVTINQLQISKNLCIIILLLAELGTGVDTCGARQRRKRILGDKKKPIQLAFNPIKSSLVGLEVANPNPG